MQLWQTFRDLAHEGSLPRFVNALFRKLLCVYLGSRKGRTARSLYRELLEEGETEDAVRVVEDLCACGHTGPDAPLRREDVQPVASDMTVDASLRKKAGSLARQLS